MKKLLVITYYWPPSGGAGVQRWLKFVKYLPEYGIQPIVLTVDDKKAAYPLKDESFLLEIPAEVEVHKTNTLEPFAAYQKLTGTKQLPHGGFANEQNPSLKQRLYRFVRGNFFIPDPRRGWNFYAYAKALELIKQHNISTVVTTSPPHSTQLLGLKLKENLGIKWVADLRDPWTDIYYYQKLYHTWLAKKIDEHYEESVLKHADKIIVVSDDMKRLFSNKYAGISSKIEVIPNGYDPKDFEEIKTKNPTDLLITYTGTITKDYNINAFIKAVGDLKKENPEISIKVRFVGSIVTEYAQQLSMLLDNNFEFLLHVSHHKAIQYIAESKILLLAIPDMPNNNGILTGKLFEYMAVGKPILCLGPIEGDAAKIIAETNTGKTFNYEDLEGIKQFLLKCFKSPDDFSGNERVKLYTRRALTECVAKLL